MNILLVTIDCLRRDRCGIYGHHRNTTPTLDALAQEAHVFENAYATGPVTTESFPGILAGRLSAQTIAGSTIYQKCLPEGAETIASHLRDKGWSTTAVISNPRIGEHTGADRGFDSFRNLRSAGGESSVESSEYYSGLLPDLEVGERLYQLRERMRGFDILPYRYEIPFLAFRYYQYFSGWPSVQGEGVVDEFLRAIADCSSPFFGWTHLMDVHGPLHPRTVAEGGMSESGTFTQFRSHAKRMSNLYSLQTEAHYESTVRYTDGQLRRIIDYLKSNGLWDETVLVVTADHGDALHDRGIYGHPQHYMFDELLAVPLVVRVPGREGSIVEHPFSLGWIHELVSELSEISKLDAPLSSSHKHHLIDRSITSGTDELLFADSISGRGHSVAVRQGNLKYHSSVKDEINDEFAVQGTFDTQKDPKERSPFEDHDTGLREHAQNITVQPKTIRQEANIGGVDSATKDRLKQLGYAE